MSMRKAFFVLLLLGLSCAYAVTPLQEFSDDAQHQRYVSLTNTFRCLVCQNQTIAESDAPLAVDLRSRVAELVRDNKSDDAIVKYMVERYGDFVVYQPPVQANTLFLWLSPGVSILFGLLVVIFFIRQHRKRAVRSYEIKLEKDRMQKIFEQHGKGR